MVNPVAASAGVPSYIWQSIVLMESGGNPNSHYSTSREDSYGLFQLNTMGGQGSDYASNPSVLYNPRLNAEIAMPSISAAYWEGVNSGYGGADLAAYTAANSGHPGFGLSLNQSAVVKVHGYAESLLGSGSSSELISSGGNPGASGVSLLAIVVGVVVLALVLD